MNDTTMNKPSTTVAAEAEEAARCPECSYRAPRHHGDCSLLPMFPRPALRQPSLLAGVRIVADRMEDDLRTHGHSHNGWRERVQQYRADLDAAVADAAGKVRS